MRPPPRYVSTQIGEEMASGSSLPLLKIQHHWAHMASCMEDNGLEGRAFGIIWTAQGWGQTGQCGGRSFLQEINAALSGGEASAPSFFQAERRLYAKLGALPSPFCGTEGRERRLPLSPGERREAGADSHAEGVYLCVEASSMGRLFDGVDAFWRIGRRPGTRGRARRSWRLWGRRRKGPRRLLGPTGWPFMRRRESAASICGP